MKLNKAMCKIIADLEYRIGTECYNPNSYDGWNNIEGCSFRYPISFPDKDGDYEKIRGRLTDKYYVDPKYITPEAITYMKYKFGSNELFVGRGIIRVLDYLEKVYGLDFNELEANRVKKRKKNDSEG